MKEMQDTLTGLVIERMRGVQESFRQAALRWQERKTAVKHCGDQFSVYVSTPEITSLSLMGLFARLTYLCKFRVRFNSNRSNQSVLVFLLA